MVQVYGARAYNWRGAFGIHTWIAAKRSHASHYTVYQVIGWNRYRGRSVVSVSRVGPPDFLCYNARPRLLLERRGGTGVEELIDRIEAAVAAYPYEDEYRVWPGPNSNTFTAFVARQVPDLGLDLPPTAIGKDYLSGGRILDRMPSGSGWQVSLLGLLGIGLAWEEGIEVNLLGLSAGLKRRTRGAGQLRHLRSEREGRRRQRRPLGKPPRRDLAMRRQRALPPSAGSGRGTSRSGLSGLRSCLRGR